jgi:hypothetical protein
MLSTTTYGEWVPRDVVKGDDQRFTADGCTSIQSSPGRQTEKIVFNRLDSVDQVCFAAGYNRRFRVADSKIRRTINVDARHHEPWRSEAGDRRRRIV